ncbi:MAG: DNA-3-methyladenine glycosylase 2 family protein [Clostridia bacterium]|nr:DNA-3-methyladenine glycosylase 2 family protein [Clostridia bacterium]
MITLKTEIKQKIKIHENDLFSPVKTFDCGQAFRFEEKEDFIEGVINKTLLRIPKADTKGYIEYFSDKNCDAFFDPLHSYTEMTEGFLAPFSGKEREKLEEALERGFGIRILKQDFKEALFSFIISQNNNIPRIKKNVASISEKFGEPFEYEGNTYYAFPSPEALLWAGETGLNECKLGFRTKYILDAAKKLHSGEIDEDELNSLDVDSAREKLKTVKGIGDKVAACTLLYGMGRLECVPVDVWMKKIFDKYFDSVPHLGEFGGVAQQYLFYNERYIVSKM